ncbi:MAG: hypothetical protein OEX02_04415 [Cyclobacteriaceae bacterium]|nr:hypothetical protein [Cyclobacteriaceae bacterium]
MLKKNCDNYYPPESIRDGLSFNSYQRNGSTPNDFLYNGKERQDELDIGWMDYGARMYMADIGRWGVVDPKADDILQVDLTPYNYSWNDPVNIKDKDGECPMCWGAVFGAVTDIALQVATNVASGEKPLKINWGSVVVSTVAGAASGGLATIKKLNDGRKLMKAIKLGTEGVINGSASAANQAITNGEVDIENVAIDATLGTFVSHKTSKRIEAKAKASPKGRQYARDEQRKQRVANNSTRKPSRQAKQQANADKAKGKYNSFGKGRGTGAGVATQGTAGKAVNLAEEKWESGGYKIEFELNVPKPVGGLGTEREK